MSTPLRANMLQAKVWTFVAQHLQAQQLWRSRQSITGLNVALNASEVRAQAVLEHVADGIVTATEGGLIESFNASAQRLFGYTEEEIVGQPFQLVLAPSHRDGFFYPGFAMWMLPSANEAASQRTGERGRAQERLLLPDRAGPQPDADRRDRTLTVFCIRDISGRKAHTDALEHRALHDDLTGLPNRTLFCDRIDRTLASAGRASESRALLVVDLNRFREFNATHGREQGDAVLGRSPAACAARSATGIPSRAWATTSSGSSRPRRPGWSRPSVIAWNVRQVFERPFLVGDRAGRARREHRYRVLSAARPDHGRPAAPGRAGDASGQARRQRHDGLRLRSRRSDRAADVAPQRAARRDPEGRAGPALPAEGRSDGRAAHDRRRGARALEAPDRRAADARSVHPRGRVHRADRAAHELGARRRPRASCANGRTRACGSRWRSTSRPTA